MARHLDNVELKLSSALERVKDRTWSDEVSGTMGVTFNMEARPDTSR